MALASYIADKSALARLHVTAVRDELGPLIRDGLVGVCGIVETEMLVSARNVDDHDEIRAQLRSLEWVPTPDEVWTWVARTQHALTERGLHRAVPIPDLLVAATADRHGLTVLHCDADFDTITDVTGVPTRWAAPRHML